MKKKIKSALVSVYDKTGLDVVVTKMDELGIKIYSTGGTFDFIESMGIPVKSIEEMTGQVEMLGGRVKTLHPKVFGGILFQRASKSDKKDVQAHGLEAIDLVVVDLYPFEQTVANLENDGLTDDDAIEKIDIGGVSLIRAAAKNHKDVLVIGHKDQYGLLMQTLENGGSTTFDERREFAIDAFNITSNYDAQIFKYLLGDGLSDMTDVEGLGRAPQDGAISLSITKDDYSLNDFMIAWSRFGHRPNRVHIQNTYSTKLFNKAMSDLILEKNVFTEVLPDSEELIINDRIFAKIDEGCYLSYVVIDRNMDNSFIDSVLFMYADGFDRIQDYVDLLNECLLDFEEDSENKLNTITLTQNGLEIEPINFHDVDTENIDIYYSKETFSSVEKSIKKIKKADRGITVFYGDRGTGKTTMINHLASKLDRIVIFVPNNMIEHTVNNPEFRRFLKRFEKPILIFDDCELLLNEMYNKANLTTTNLVQMVDGFLAGTVDVSVVAIFNTDTEDEIDHNLLECNNLLDVVGFTSLCVDEANELAKHIESSKKYKSETRMIDVVRKRTTKPQTTVGF